MSTYERVTLNFGLRARAALVVVAISFGVLGLRLWYLQILRGEYFRERSRNNLIRTVYISPPRGEIKDRNGNTLVKNRPAFNVEFVLEDSPEPKETVAELESVLSLRPGELLEQISRPQKKRRRYEPKLLLKDVDRDVLAKVAVNKHKLPGVSISVVPTREYVHGDLAAHVVGYIREVSAEQLEGSRYSGYRSGDLVGQYGVEKVHEYLLHGKRGLQGLIVNAAGHRIGESYYEPARSGHTVTLTIDRDLQRIAEEQLGDRRGAVVALDPHTGELLALASKPSFNPNDFTGEISPATWKQIVFGKEKRLANRAVQGVYPPGSIFKLVVSAAAIAEGVVGGKERVACGGHFTVGRSKPFHCHKREGHGSMSLSDAIRRSCNIFFFTIGQRLGVDRIHDYAVRFGLGAATGLELIQEAKGLIPSRAWKKSYYSTREDQKWYPGETPSVSIGQGAVTVTPLQIAQMTAAFVNGGKIRRPYVVSQIRSHDGEYIEDGFQSKEVKNVEVPGEALDTVRAGLFAVVNEEGGTGSRARLPENYGIAVAGKTGTAQIRRMDPDEPQDEEGSDDIAWFAGYAPAEEAEIVVVALIEDGGHGGVTAAPIVRNVMEEYFKERAGDAAA